MGLLEPEQPTVETPYYRLIQNLNRFLLERLHQDIVQCDPHYNSGTTNSSTSTSSSSRWSLIQQIYGWQLKNITTCCQCREENSRAISPLSIDLISSSSQVLFSHIFSYYFLHIKLGINISQGFICCCSFICRLVETVASA